MNEECEICGKEIEDGTGDEYIDSSCGYVFWVCDRCIEESSEY